MFNLFFPAFVNKVRNQYVHLMLPLAELQQKATFQAIEKGLLYKIKNKSTWKPLPIRVLELWGEEEVSFPSVQGFIKSKLASCSP
jgi:hypothetical protein